MTSRRRARSPFPLVLVLALAAMPMLAAAQVPTRNGNEANGRDYQPSQSTVRSGEQNAGIAPTPQRDHAATNEVETLNHQLQNAENNDPQVHPHGAGKVNPDR